MQILCKVGRYESKRTAVAKLDSKDCPMAPGQHERRSGQLMELSLGPLLHCHYSLTFEYVFNYCQFKHYRFLPFKRKKIRKRIKFSTHTLSDKRSPYTHIKMLFHSLFRDKKMFEISKQQYSVSEHPNTTHAVESGI